MSINLESVDLLEGKLISLVERYAFLKEENDILLSNIDILQSLISKYEEELTSEKEKYRLLKIAKTIEGSTKDSRETKNKINALVREIDKCIVKLNQ
tara:strand:- start:24599 stop:24889 length:291 start_codon:yes stop_codon:yes gene_type:complete